MRHSATGTWYDTPSLLAKGATLRTAIAEEIARSHKLCWRTRDLLLAPYPWIRPIAGGLDPDGSAVLEVLAAGGTVCLDCVVRKTGVPALSVANVLQRFNDIVVIAVTTARCDGCLRLTETYAVDDRTDTPPALRPVGGNGAKARPPDLADTLWQFLAEHRGEMFCTACLSNSLNVTRRIDRAAMVVEGRGARRQYGACSECGKDRLLCGLVQ
jgi:hypothetical protein